MKTLSEVYTGLFCFLLSVLTAMSAPSFFGKTVSAGFAILGFLSTCDILLKLMDEINRLNRENASEKETSSRYLEKYQSAMKRVTELEKEQKYPQGKPTQTGHRDGRVLH